ncbi:MAG: Rrf2 family transcriptional regulator [Candidatus Moranbacteria bacterium]|nr:Rrf2 family transcriptional regulator [Candidatus Moranbacteria bacterium]
MKISKKAYYGLRAVLALAQSDKPLSTHTIANAEHIPEDYLEKILQSLRRANLVMAHKGMTGGYVLARPAKEISVWDILCELDGPIKTFSAPVKGALPCLQVSHCQTNEVWRTLENKVKETLSNISLGSLVPKNTTS